MSWFASWQGWKGKIMIDKGVDEPGSSLRVLVSQALRSYPTRVLNTFLDDKNTVVRTAAARELQSRGEVESFEFAVSLLSDRRAYMREIGVFILGQLGTPDYPYKDASIDLIAERLSLDKSQMVRASAAAALGHLKASSKLDILIYAASDESANVRACAAFALTRMKRRPKAREALCALRNDENPEVRCWAND